MSSLPKYPEVLTLNDVARYLQLHPMTVYKLARERRLPSIKLGGQWRFQKAKLDNWLATKETI